MTECRNRNRGTATSGNSHFAFDWHDVARISVFSIALLSFPEPVRAQEVGTGIPSSREATEAYARGDYTAAANTWLAESYEGSREAQYNLGVMYIEGKGVPQSRDQAIFWLTQAANAGHVEAQYNLGHLYLEQKEDMESRRTGLEWWRKAATRGFGIAQYNYGRALFFGIGTKADLAASKFWMEQSLTNGERAAARFLEAKADKFDIIKSDNSLILTLVVEEAPPRKTVQDVSQPETVTGTATGRTRPQLNPEPVSEKPASSDLAFFDPDNTVAEAASDSENGEKMPEATGDMTVDKFVAALEGQSTESQQGPGTAEEPSITVQSAPPAPVEEPMVEEGTGEAVTGEVETGTGESQFVDEFLLSASGSQIKADIHITSGPDNDNGWLYDQNPGHATWELVRIRDRKLAKDMLGDLDGNGRLFSTVQDHYRWYFILWGQFPNARSASGYQASLPAWAGTAKLKTFGVLQKERCTQAGLLESHEAEGLTDICRNY